jgi:Galactose oxidase, central domain
MLIVLIAIALACGCGSSRATAPAPAVLLGRTGATVVYDTSRHVVLLYGGRGPSTTGGAIADQSGLWSFDGTAWTRITTAGGPSARNASAGAFDAARQRFVLFGGRTGNSPLSPVLSDTWEWTGSAWVQSLAFQTGLVGRDHPAGGYDPVRHLVTMVGGFDPGTGVGLHDQWDWNGNSWDEVSTTVPGSGYAPVLVSSGSTLYLLQSNTSDRMVNVLAATGGGQWNAIAPAGGVAPKATSYATATFPGGGVLLFGGSDGTNLLDETWKWDGAAWAKLAITGPPGRVGHAMALDAARGKVVLFGGETNTATLGDTWEFDGAAWKQITTLARE